MTKHYFNEHDFLNPTSISSYIMGYFWGDCYIPEKYNSIVFEIVEKDWEVIKYLFDSFGTYSIHKRTRINRQPQIGITISNKILKDLFISLNYKSKSFISHKIVLSHIPDNLKYYWVRGFFDADGCVYYNEKQSLRQFNLCSTYEQDWGYFHNLLLNNNINCSIMKRNHKNSLITGNSSKSSVVRGSGRETLINLFNYLYPNQIYDGIGLKRKFDKFLHIATLPILKPGPKPKIG